MKRPRVSIAGLMAAVAVVAVDVAVMRSVVLSGTGAEAMFSYVCGVLPMASLLSFVAMIAAPNILRDGRVSPFVLGFEAVGWSAVFAFISCYSISMREVIEFGTSIARPIRPYFVANLAHAPMWLQASVELVFAIVLFSTPQLLAALIGGFAARTLGVSVRFERRGARPAMTDRETMRPTVGPDPPAPTIQPVAGTLR